MPPGPALPAAACSFGRDRLGARRILTDAQLGKRVHGRFERAGQRTTKKRDADADHARRRSATRA